MKKKISPESTELDYKIMLARGVVKEILRESGNLSAHLETGTNIVLNEFSSTHVVSKESMYYEDGSIRWRQGFGNRWFTKSLPCYSTDIRDAASLLEELIREDLPNGMDEISIIYSKDKCTITHISTDTYSSATTFPEAACKFYLNIKENSGKEYI
jgi:hypothetical protein